MGSVSIRQAAGLTSTAAPGGKDGSDRRGHAFRALLVSPLREHARQPTKRIERDRCDEPLQGSNQDLLVDELAHEPQGDAEQSQDRPDQGDDRSPPSGTATHFHGPQPPGPERLRTRLAVRRGLRVRRLTTEDAHLRGGEAGVFLLPRPM